MELRFALNTIQMFKKDMTSAVDNLFADMMKMPTIFGSNMIDRIFATEPKELEEVKSIENRDYTGQRKLFS